MDWGADGSGDRRTKTQRHCTEAERKGGVSGCPPGDEEPRKSFQTSQKEDKTKEHVNSSLASKLQRVQT